MSKIEWCDETWNPVWGCKTNCPYCYAKKIAARFFKKMAWAEYKYLLKEIRMNEYDLMAIESDLKEFKPTWLESNFNKPFPKKPKRIFVNSMSDIAYWNHEWINKVINKIYEYPQHQFLFLTKQPDTYDDYTFPLNCWLGITIIKNKDFERHSFFAPLHAKTSNWSNVKFISIEPMVEKIDINNIHKRYIDWLIIGAETGNRKNKIIPEPDWIEPFRNLDIPVFMKNNLRPIVDNLKQEFPIA